MSEDIQEGEIGATPPPKASAGAQLKAAREAAGLHVAALAVSMKVPVKKLEALEADRWDLLPDAAFVRALASSVCRTLKIDPAPILSTLPQLSAPRLDTEERGINTPFQSTGQGGVQSVSAFFARPTVLVVIALLAGAMAVLFVPDFHVGGNAVSQALSASPVAANPEAPASSDGVAMGVSSVFSDTPATVPPSSPPPASPSPASPPPAPVTAPSAVVASSAAPAVAPVATTAPGTAAGTSASSVAAAAASALVAARPASTAVANSGTGILVFRAKEPTWVEVSDARKVVLIRRTLANGETVGFSGELPLSVVVGKVDGVAVEVRGQPLTMEPLAGTNVARFEVK